MSDAAYEIERLRDGINDLRHIWWTKGVDIDKDAVAAQCFKLFALLPRKE